MSHSHTPSAAAVRRPRRLAAIATAAALAAGLFAVPATPATAAPAIPQTGLIGEYLFDETAGTSVPNTATGPGAVGAATVVNGTAAQWTGTSLVFAGGAKTSTTANWVRLPDNLLAGKQSATITIETKFDPTMLTNWNFLWNIGSDATTQYYFMSVRDKARTTITTSGGGGEVNARTATSLSANRWYSLTWWRDHADHHMTILLSPDGPFARSKDTCDPGEPLPHVEPPAGWFPDLRETAR